MWHFEQKIFDSFSGLRFYLIDDRPLKAYHCNMLGIKSTFLKSFIQYLLPFFIVLTLFDLAFEDLISWSRNLLSALVFGSLMSYFKHRGRP